MGVSNESYTLSVQGMTCGHCEARVEKAVGALPGVEKVKADAQKGEVQVTASGAGPDKQAVQQAITKAGYAVRN